MFSFLLYLRSPLLKTPGGEDSLWRVDARRPLSRGVPILTRRSSRHACVPIVLFVSLSCVSLVIEAGKGETEGESLGSN